MPRYLHTSIFVSDMAASIAFYTEQLGLTLLDGPLHYPGNADMAFVGADWSSYISNSSTISKTTPRINSGIATST